MKNDWFDILRQAAADPLPDGAFLRRDRSDGLFVTDAPRRRPGVDWPARMYRAGFIGRVENGLLRLWPGEEWAARLEADAPDPPDDLCLGLLRFSGVPPEAESIALLVRGIKCLDGGEDAARFDRLLRQRAAVCLRLNRTAGAGCAGGPVATAPPVGRAERRSDVLSCPHGGGLYACALLDHMIRFPL